MRHRQPLPTVWLITDPRGGDPLVQIERLPRRSGVVVRHFDLAAPDRVRLFAQVQAAVQRRGGIALLATPPDRLGRWAAVDPETGLRAVAVHSRREYLTAWRTGADLVFVAPVFATRTHPGARALGPVRLGLILDGRLPAVALGGMTAQGFRRLNGLGLHGWAAIDAFRI
jgi:thiamine-phosphate pyrophosphorylase